MTIAQLAIGRGLTLLTCDKDFTQAALDIPLKVWNSGIVERGVGRNGDGS